MAPPTLTGRAAEDSVRKLILLVTSELEAVSPSAAAARVQADTALESAMKSGDEVALRGAHASLLADISTAEASKRTALESELVRLDAALELVQARCGRVRAALTSLEPDRLVALHPRMAASLTDAFAQLRESLPCGPEVEATIELVPVSPAHPTLSPLGSLCTQRARADDLEVTVSPAAGGAGLRHVIAGGVVEFEIRASSCQAHVDPRAVAAVARCAQFVVRLVPPVSTPPRSSSGAEAESTTAEGPAQSAGTRLHAAIAPCADRTVTVTVYVPADAPTGTRVRLERVLLAGSAVTRGVPSDVLVAPSAAIAGTIARGFAPGAVSAWIPGILDPLLLKYGRRAQTPAVSDDGRLFVPCGRSVTVYSLAAGAEGDRKSVV